MGALDGGSWAWTTIEWAMIELAADLLERVARRMHLLADPTRLRLLFALEDGEACVQQLADQLGLVHRNVVKDHRNSPDAIVAIPHLE
jgi:Bacterial regulatory protein, arsR family